MPFLPSDSTKVYVVLVDYAHCKRGIFSLSGGSFFSGQGIFSIEGRSFNTIKTSVGNRTYGLILTTSCLKPLVEDLVTNQILFTTAFIQKDLYNYYLDRDCSL